MPVQVICKRGYANREAEPIISELINSATMAKAVGKRFLDDPAQGSYYYSRLHKFTAPYRLGVHPGTFISVTSERMGLDDTELRVETIRIYKGNATLLCDIEATEFISPLG